ncbi:hypothetical protein BGY98DRAFT_1172080 [Russula aff. rugulosa BPL654]|nr:hypothetical protein BGY98DRAFT_1172080 [Russula aff. rugulosa BPL654]
MPAPTAERAEFMQLNFACERVNCEEKANFNSFSVKLPSRPPTVITYSYASRFVYVTPAETHDGAIDIAKESFRELKDVERERISFEIRVKVMNTQQPRTAEIWRTAWPTVVALLSQFEIMEIRVAPVAPHGQTGVALSSSQASAVEPPPYAPEKGRYSDSQTNIAPYGSQTPNLQSPSPPSLVTRIMNLLTPKSSQSRPSP